MKPQTKQPQSIPNPCVRNCCLDEQDICLGCFRTLKEILNWSHCSKAEQLAILKNCLRRKQHRPHV